jgi:hypothetical protein
MGTEDRDPRRYLILEIEKVSIMKMMLNKIPTPIQVCVVLVTFILYVVFSALYLNAPPVATAALQPQTIPVPPVPVDPALVPALAELTMAEAWVCKDADAPGPVDMIVMAAATDQQPLSEESPKPEPKKPEPPFHRLILQAADEHDIEPALIRAVILAESNYNPKAVSKRGARGLMQLMPSTAAALGVVDLFDPADNINGGVKYLRQLLDRFDNDLRLALAAYNAGSRHVRNYNGVPPFRATRLYIKKVFKYQTLFQAEMASNRQTV